MQFLNKHILLSLLLTSCGFVSEEESTELLKKNTSLGVEDIDGDGLENRVDSRPLIFNRIKVDIFTPNKLEILQIVHGDLATTTLVHELNNHKIISINRDRLSEYFNRNDLGQKVGDAKIEAIELFKLTQPELRKLLNSRNRQFSKSTFKFSNKVKFTVRGADGFAQDELIFDLLRLNNHDLLSAGKVIVSIKDCNAGNTGGVVCDMDFSLSIDDSLIGTNDIYFYLVPSKMNVVRNGVKFDYVKKQKSVRGRLRRLVYIGGEKREVINASKQVSFQEMIREIYPKAELREDGFVWLHYKSKDFDTSLSAKELLENYKNQSRIQYKNNPQAMIVREIRANDLISKRLKRENLKVSINQDANKFLVSPTTEDDYVSLKINKIIEKRLIHDEREKKTSCLKRTCSQTTIGDVKCYDVPYEHTQLLYSISSELEDKESHPSNFSIKNNGISKRLEEITNSTFLGAHTIYLKNTKSFQPFQVEMDLVRTFYDIGTYIQDQNIITGCNPLPKPHKSKVETHRYLFELELEGEQ